MKRKENITRKISPWLGLLGFMGILGPICYKLTNDPTALIFIAFFGFFGFYFEGKMSGTLMDERFKYNQQRAAAVAGKVNSLGMVFALIITANYVSRMGIDVAYTFLIGSLASMWGLQILLQGFLLYHYENQE